MLLDMQMAVEILHADVVDVEVIAGGDGADTIEDVFGPSRARHGMDHYVGIRQNFTHPRCDCTGRWLGARHGMDHYVGIRQNFTHPRCDCSGHLLRPLKGEVAFESYGNIGEIAVAGFSKAHTLYFKHTLNRANRSE